MANPTPRSLRRRVLVAAQILTGVIAGLLVAEVAFSVRDQHAFPHLNLYVEDPTLGVRLEPSSSMNFQLRDNPVTHISVNAQGYRGQDWPRSTESNSEIIVIGDSQVFGLGVNDDETFAAQLAARTGETVLNAGVPTYGPPEYLALADELLARKPKLLVLTLNFLNDPFELERKNLERHRVWDGWAVRTEHAPNRVQSFPGGTGCTRVRMRSMPCAAGGINVLSLAPKTPREPKNGSTSVRRPRAGSTISLTIACKPTRNWVSTKPRASKLSWRLGSELMHWMLSWPPLATPSTTY